MKPEIAQLWADTLRSGQFTPTESRGLIYDGGDCRCAVGVLVDLFLTQHPQYLQQYTNQSKNISSQSLQRTMYVSCMSELAKSKQLAEWAGTEQMDSWVDTTFLAKCSQFYEKNYGDYGNVAAFILEHHGISTAWSMDLLDTRQAFTELREGTEDHQLTLSPV